MHSYHDFSAEMSYRDRVAMYSMDRMEREADLDPNHSQHPLGWSGETSTTASDTEEGLLNREEQKMDNPFTWPEVLMNPSMFGAHDMTSADHAMALDRAMAGNLSPFFSNDIWAPHEYSRKNATSPYISKEPSWSDDAFTADTAYRPTMDPFMAGAHDAMRASSMARDPFENPREGRVDPWMSQQQSFRDRVADESGMGRFRSNDDEQMLLKLWASLADKGLPLDLLMKNSFSDRQNLRRELTPLQRDWVTKGITTIMLRNIPNKYTQQMLIEEMNEASFGNIFDFLYLPVDSDKNANLGYAFINFMQPEFAARFKEVFEGSRMKRFNSKKVACVTPATLQGYAANYNHFEAKRVTKAENPSHRPMFLKGKPTPSDERVANGPGMARLARKDKKEKRPAEKKASSGQESVAAENTTTTE